MVDSQRTAGAERERLAADARREKNWKRWGPYLSERQWGTVREDYSADGDCWRYFPHDDARRRAYRWGEDGLLGWCDREGRLCFALALWNGRDPILKERLFGLSNHEGNHGEDVKELYYYLDSTPTHSYAKALYKYPHARFPYEHLVEENARRGKDQPEFEITDTGVFDEDRYFDVLAEYAKQDDNDVLIRLTATNRGSERATLHLLPTLWFRNTWTWGCEDEGCVDKAALRQAAGASSGGKGRIEAEHETLGRFSLVVGPPPGGGGVELLFTGNESNQERLFQAASASPYVKDAFHRRVIHNEERAVNPDREGTKAAAWYRLDLGPGEAATVKLRLRETAPPSPRKGRGEGCSERSGVSGGGPDNLKPPYSNPLSKGEGDEGLGEDFDRIFDQRLAEAEAFYTGVIPASLGEHEKLVSRQAYAGLLWSKQFYYYVVETWLQGDANEPPPPAGRGNIRNGDWPHLFSRDVLSMPDKWEYPWFAAWDLAFHMLPMCRVDPDFAKGQLMVLLREWYMHPSGQLPAYEFAFSDANPPVHAYACWRVYKMSAPRGRRDRRFLAATFQKLLLNFTWWVNRKDARGRHLFRGGFLGLDNIGPFDRSRPLPGAEQLTQADGTAWMAFFCVTMLNIALELATDQPEYEDMASKFFEHFIAIVDAINSLGGEGLWDPRDGFYYDRLSRGGVANGSEPIRLRSLVGLIPLLAVGVVEQKHIDQLPGFKKRTDWFLEHRQDLARHVSLLEREPGREDDLYLLAVPSKDRLRRVLGYMLDENEFLSPFGIRSLSKVHAADPYRLMLDGQAHEVRYEPGESESGMFGGNSNWRGPVWFPLNHLLIEALQRYHRFYGEKLKVECPTGSGRLMNLREVAMELQRRLARLFTTDTEGHRPCHGGEPRYRESPHFNQLVLFHEYFHAQTGRGLGASHQTGWTSLITHCFEDLARDQSAKGGRR